MRILISVLGLAITVAAVVALNLAVIEGFAEGASEPRVAWSRLQLIDALAIFVLGIVATIIVWVQPVAAEAVLLLAVLAGLVGMALEASGVANVRGDRLTMPVALASVLVGGALPAMVALAAAALTHRFLLPAAAIAG